MRQPPTQREEAASTNIGEVPAGREQRIDRKGRPRLRIRAACHIYNAMMMIEVTATKAAGVGDVSRE